MSEVLPTRSESESERELPRWPIIMGLVITLVGPLFLSVLDRTQGLRFQIIQGVLLGIAVLVAGWVWSTQRRQRVRMVWHPRKAHLIQAVSHGIVYAYWATQNPGLQSKSHSYCFRSHSHTVLISVWPGGGMAPTCWLRPHSHHRQYQSLPVDD